MGLLDSTEKKMKEKPLKGDKLSSREKEAQANLAMAQVAKDPGALPTQGKFVQQSIKTYMDKNYPCDHREFIVHDSKGRPVKAAPVMHVLCDAEYKGRRDHYYTQCLDCTIIKTDLKNNKPKCLIQELMYLEKVEEAEHGEGESGVGIFDKTRKNLKESVDEELTGKESKSRDYKEDPEYEEFLAWKKRNE